MSEYITGPPKFAIDAALLHEPFTKDMLSHDPYTPESIESHSPFPEEKKDEKTDTKKQSVSPRILKSRLENILRTEKEKKVHINLHKPVCYTQSDNCGKFLGYVKDEHKKLEFTQSDASSKYSKTSKDSRFLSKSQSQYLDSKYLDESDMFTRGRCMTEVSRKISRAKLISTTSAQSMHRLQSHHSSSDEEWFEFEEVDLEDDTFEETKIDDIPPKNDVIKVEPLKIDQKSDKNGPQDPKKVKKKKIEACCTVS